MDDRDEKNYIESFKKATKEAIYWWNDSEDFYHRCFTRFDEIIGNDSWGFFKDKILKRFLNDYSIRRNIAGGDNGLDKYFEKLKEEKFFSGVINTKPEDDSKVIDGLSGDLKEFMSKNEAYKKGNNTISLLSKIAHMINPNAFPILDSLAKDSLKDKIKEIENIKRLNINLDIYSNYKLKLDKLIKIYDCEKRFDISNSELEKYKGTAAYIFYIKRENESAFRYRVVDKLLWLEGVERNKKELRKNIKECLKKLEK